MRFKIFGGGDCSDMFLAQFVPVTTLSPSELQELANRVIALATSSAPDTERDRIFLHGEAPPSLTSQGDIASACCAVHTILTNIAIYDVEGQQASRELVILGLSQNAADVIVQVAASHKSALFASMAPSVRMAPAVSRIHVKRGDDEDVGGGEDKDDFVVSIDKRSSVGGGTTASDVVSFGASTTVLKSLLSELMTARESINAASAQ